MDLHHADEMALKAGDTGDHPQSLQASLQALSDWLRSELSVNPHLEYTGDLMTDVRSVKRQLAQERKHHKMTKISLEDTVQTLSDEKTQVRCESCIMSCRRCRRPIDFRPLCFV